MANLSNEQNSDVPYKRDNFYAKVIYYRHYKYYLQERTTTQAVQEVAS